MALAETKDTEIVNFFKDLLSKMQDEGIKVLINGITETGSVQNIVWHKWRNQKICTKEGCGNRYKALGDNDAGCWHPRFHQTVEIYYEKIMGFPIDDKSNNPHMHTCRNSLDSNTVQVDMSGGGAYATVVNKKTCSVVTKLAENLDCFTSVFEKKTNLTKNVSLVGNIKPTKNRIIKEINKIQEETKNYGKKISSMAFLRCLDQKVEELWSEIKNLYQEGLDKEKEYSEIEKNTQAGCDNLYNKILEETEILRKKINYWCDNFSSYYHNYSAAADFKVHVYFPENVFSEQKMLVGIYYHDDLVLQGEIKGNFTNVVQEECARGTEFEVTVSCDSDGGFAGFGKVYWLDWWARNFKRDGVSISVPSGVPTSYNHDNKVGTSVLDATDDSNNTFNALINGLGSSCGECIKNTKNFGKNFVSAKINIDSDYTDLIKNVFVANKDTVIEEIRKKIEKYYYT